MRYELLSKDGKKIAGTLLASDTALLPSITAESQLLRNGAIRAGCITNANGKITAFSNDPDLLRSSQKFKTIARSILESIKYIDEISEEQRKNSRRLIHNLTSINAHNIQEIYSLIPQEEISGKMRGHVDYVKKIITQNSTEAAKIILRLAKNNAAMKTEFSVFKKLFDASPDLRPSSHVVHKVLMNLLYLFFPDFTDKTVDVVVDQSNATAFFDYESMHVALYHMIDNAAKYTKPNSELKISINLDSSNLFIAFRMLSIKIFKDESGRIFDEGFSGRIPIHIGKSGDGIGMSLVKRIIESNGGQIGIKIHDESQETHFGIDYQINEFVVTLPLAKVSPPRNVHT